jgi:hypothetical protein
MKTLIVAFVFVFLGGVAAAQNTYTACLANGGSITKVGIGPEPKSPCTGNQIQISWNEQGPAGQDGQDGQDGAQGPPGQDGEPEPPGPAGTEAQHFELVGTTPLIRNGGVGILNFTAPLPSRIS